MKLFRRQEEIEDLPAARVADSTMQSAKNRMQ